MRVLYEYFFLCDFFGSSSRSNSEFIGRSIELFVASARAPIVKGASAETLQRLGHHATSFTGSRLTSTGYMIATSSKSTWLWHKLHSKKKKLNVTRFQGVHFAETKHAVCSKETATPLVNVCKYFRGWNVFTWFNFKHLGCFLAVRLRSMHI